MAFEEFVKRFEKRSSVEALMITQEGGVNLADPMMTAIMTSQRKKRANAQNFRKWRPRPSTVWSGLLHSLEPQIVLCLC